MEENNMRRLMLTLTLITMILVGCAVQPFHATETPDKDMKISALSLGSQIQLYVMDNEEAIAKSLDSWGITLPKIVTEATAEDRKAIACLAKNIYWEAGGESVRGKAAVAQVTVNRAEDGRFASDICGVVYERDRVKVRGKTRTICQFSWTCMKVKNKTPKNNDAWDSAVEVAQKFVLDGTSLPELEEALFYHAAYVRPRWTRSMVRIERIGSHIFYRERVKPAEKVVYLAANL
jgi:spore germination cell wall hydrolase CwlJ-like protein